MKNILFREEFDYDDHLSRMSEFGSVLPEDVTVVLYSKLDNLALEILRDCCADDASVHCSVLGKTGDSVHSYFEYEVSTKGSTIKTSEFESLEPGEITTFWLYFYRLAGGMCRPVKVVVEIAAIAKEDDKYLSHPEICQVVDEAAKSIIGAIMDLKGYCVFDYRMNTWLPVYE